MKINKFCPVCQYGEIETNDLSESYPYVCNTCGTVFKSWINLSYSKNYKRALISTIRYWRNKRIWLNPQHD